MTKKPTYEELEKKIQGLEQWYSTIMEASLQGVYQVDVKGLITFANPIFAKLTGYSLAELYGLSLDILFPDDETKTISNANIAVLAPGNPIVGENTLVRKDGSRIEISFSCSPVMDDSDEYLGFVGSILDITEHKQMVDKLLKSEEKFKTMFAQAPLSYQSLDGNGNFIEVNDTWLNVLGYKRHEVIDKNFSEFLHPDWKDHFRENFPRFKAVGEVLGVEFKILKKDDSYILVSFHGKIGKDKNENFQKTHCIFQDITERKKMENSLQSYSHELAERVKELNCLFEISKLIEEKEIPFDELLQGIVDLIPPAWQHPENTCSRILIDDQEYKTENFQKTKWNQNSDISIFGERIGVLEVYYLDENSRIDEDPFLKEKLGLINAITERLERIIELKQNERDRQTLMESTIGLIGQELFDVIVVKLCEWLECDCAIIGKIIQDGTVKAISMVLDGEHVSNYSYNLKGSPCDKTIRKCYCVYPKNVSALFPDDPDLIEMDATGYVGISLEDNNGKAIGVLCGISRGKLHITKHTKNVMKIIAAKISSEIEREKIEIEKSRLEIQLQQSQKMESIGTLAGGIAHDFNNILFPIVGHVEMLMEDVPKDSPFKESLNEIYSSALRAKELVKQILTFSRQEQSELKLMKMQPIIKEALKLIRSSIPTTIEIKHNIQSDCGIIKSDPIQIHQIVMNLATNAYHAMENTGGELIVSLEKIKLGALELISPDMKSGGYACLTIADTGVGMDKSLTKKVFDPFFTTKKKGKGTGMGLSVVHGIVMNMNGAMQVYSEPGKGTEFKVYLPLVNSSSGKQESHQIKKSIPGGIEQILLVDDEEAIITMEKMMLERLGYQVTSHTSSIEALEAFRRNPDKFDLVITDMQMPNISGDKLSVELIKIRPDIPILLCTGFSETMSDEEAKSLGIKNFLLKPIFVKDLAQKIRAVLDEN